MMGPIPTLAALVILLAALILTPAFTQSPGLFSASEAKLPWTSLSDGKTMTHWQDPSKLDPPGDAWTIQDGCFKAVPHPRITEDLVSEDAYTNFALSFEWRVAPNGNSGLKYRIQSLPILCRASHSPAAHRFEDQVEAALAAKAFDRHLIQSDESAQIYVVGYEYQTIAGTHPDALRGPLYQTGALYSLIPAIKNAMHPIDQFNESLLIVRGNHIEHWLNGEKVVDGMLDAQEVKDHTAKRWGASSHTYELLAGHPSSSGHISIQNHGDAAWFRNVKIKVLPN
jgi:hypothetical protein